MEDRALVPDDDASGVHGETEVSEAETFEPTASSKAATAAGQVAPAAAVAASGTEAHSSSSGDVHSSNSAAPAPFARLKAESSQNNGQSLENTSSNASTRPLGVDIEVLRKLLEDARQLQLLSLTTKDVCDNIVKPATSDRQCQYVDLLNNQTSPTPLVAAATVFVSHAWKYDFAMVVEVLGQIAEENPSTYFWFDLVVNNQHKTENRPFEWWCSTFKDSIRCIGKVVLILSPWNDPIPLTRAWCLWEIFSAATIDEVVFECRLPEGEKPKFREAIGGDYRSVMNTLVRVQVERSEAYSTVDRDNIFNAIKQSCGFSHLNERVKQQLREWLLRAAVEMAEEMLSKGQQGVEAASFYDNVALALNDFGELNKALAYYEQALAIKLQELGADHQSVGASYNHMAIVYEVQSKYTQALEYYGKSLKIKLATLGEQHPDTAQTYNNMAVVYDSQGQYAQALEYYGKSLKIKLATLGEQHSDTATTYNNMAIVYQSQGQYGQALEYYGKDLQITLVTLGEQHPSTAQTYNNMANVYYSQDRYEKALEYYGKSLRIRLATLGEQHPDTAGTYMGMANVYKVQGQYEQALEYYGKSLKIKLATLGEQHPSTAATYNNMANVYQSQGQYEQALEYYGKSLKIQLATLGEQHPETAATYNNMGEAYRCQGQYEQALDYYGKSLKIKLTTLGDQHPHTATTYNNMAGVYDSQGQYARALDYYRISLKIKLATLGEQHPDTATTYNSMAGVCDSQGQYAQALEYYGNGLKIRLATLGEMHPETAIIYNQLAACYMGLNDHHNAVENFEKYLKTSGKAIDSHVIDLIVGSIWQTLGRHDLATQRWQLAHANNLVQEAQSTKAATLSVENHQHHVAATRFRYAFPRMAPFGFTHSCDSCKARFDLEAAFLQHWRCVEGCDFDLCAKCVSGTNSEPSPD